MIFGVDDIGACRAHVFAFLCCFCPNGHWLFLIHRELQKCPSARAWFMVVYSQFDFGGGEGKDLNWKIFANGLRVSIQTGNSASCESSFAKISFWSTWTHTHTRLPETKKDPNKNNNETRKRRRRSESKRKTEQKKMWNGKCHRELI